MHEVSDSAQTLARSLVPLNATISELTLAMQAITEENIFDSEQRGADLTKKPAQRVKKGTYLAKALVRSQLIIQLCCHS